MEELAIEETVKVFLALGATSPSYIWEFANKVTNEIINTCSLEIIESEKVIRELLLLHLNGLDNLQNVQSRYPSFS